MDNGPVQRRPMFPLSSVLFPHATLPLHVFEPRYRALVDHCVAGDGEFGVVLIARGSEVGGGDERFTVGTMARITAAAPFDDGRWVLMAEGRSRFAVSRWLADDPYPLAEVTDLPEDDGVDDLGLWERATTAVRRVRTLMSELGASAPVLEEGSAEAPARVAGDAPKAPGDLAAGSDGGRRLWQLCAMAPVTALDSQKLLEVADGSERLRLLSETCEALAGDLSLLLGGGPGT